MFTYGDGKNNVNILEILEFHKEKGGIGTLTNIAYNFNEMYDCFKKYENKFILWRAPPQAVPSWLAIPITVRETAGFSKKDFVTYLEAKRIENRMLFAENILRHPGITKEK